MGGSMFADTAKEWDDTCGRGIWCTLLQQRRNDLTYNQGVVLGGLVELSVADHDRFLKAAAQNIANAAIAHLAEREGVLHDPCDPKWGATERNSRGYLCATWAFWTRHSPGASTNRFSTRTPTHRGRSHKVQTLNLLNAGRDLSLLRVLRARLQPGRACGCELRFTQQERPEVSR